MALGWDDVYAILTAIDASPREVLEMDVGDLRLVVRKHRGRVAEGGELELKAPSVGIFRRAALTGGQPLAAPGARVHADQVIAVIHVAHQTRTVRAPGPCEIVAALVEDGEFVEYGQPIVALRSLA